MALFDLSPDQLEAYRPDLPIPGDFDEFWVGTLAETRRFPLDARFEPVETELDQLDIYDVSFAGFGGTTIRGWLKLPAHRAQGQLPVIVQYPGYQNGRGAAVDAAFWPLAGFAHLAVDVRGQGAGYPDGTGDDVGSGPQSPGFLTRGILDPAGYYYRRVYADCVRAVEAARAFPGIDPDRVIVDGISQGGGLTLAVTGLVPDLFAACADVPFLCDFPRAITITDRDPYQEIVQYLKSRRAEREQAMRTLSYVDAVHHSRRANAPLLMSVGLMDQTCPPSTGYAAFHAYGGEDKRIVAYPFNDHEGGQADQEHLKLTWLRSLLRAADGSRRW